MWFKDEKGKKSVSVTFATIAFLVTTLAYVTSIVHQIGTVQFASFDVAACGAYLAPILATYFGRRWTKAKFGEEENKQ